MRTKVPSVPSPVDTKTPLHALSAVDVVEGKGIGKIGFYARVQESLHPYPFRSCRRSRARYLEHAAQR